MLREIDPPTLKVLIWGEIDLNLVWFDLAKFCLFSLNLVWSDLFWLCLVWFCMADYCLVWLIVAWLSQCGWTKFDFVESIFV